MGPDPIEDFLQQSKDITLDPQKKELIRQALDSFMKSHPLPSRPPKKNWLTAMVWYSGFSAERPFFGGKLKTAGIALASLALVLFAGGGMASAHFALPGDSLYPVKLNVNEKILEVLAFSTQAKAKVRVQLAERRLEEMEQLMVGGRLDVASQATVQANAKQYLNKASLGIEALGSKSDAKTTEDLEAATEIIASDFESSLRAHAHILTVLSEKSVAASAKVLTPAQPLPALIKDIADTTLVVSEKRKTSASRGLELSTSQSQRVEAKITSLEDSITQVKKLINDKKDRLGQNAVAQSEANIKRAEEQIAKEKNKLSGSDNDYQASLHSLQEAGIIVGESKKLLRAKSKLKTDIDIGISLENANVDAGQYSEIESQVLDGDQSGKVDIMQNTR